MLVTPQHNADWDCFKTPVDLEDSKSTSGGTLCVLRSHTVVRWMCKKQTSVSHRSTESEIISLDAGLTDGLPALELWDLIFLLW